MQSSPFLKNAMLAVNGIIIVYSIVVISIQAASLASFQEHTLVAGDVILGVPGLSIAVGCIALVVAAVGCFTATRTSYCLGITFCVVLAMFWMLGMLIGVTYFVLFMVHCEERVATTLTEAMPAFTYSPPVALWWDQLQTQFECCGSTYAGDWVTLLNVSDYLPMSCCGPIAGQVGNSTCIMSAINRYRYDCTSRVTSFLEHDAAAAGYTLLGLAIIEIVCLIIAGFFTHPLKSMW